MANFIYRRGHVFWWRRVLRIFDSRTLDVRLSLKTFDRFEARNRSAVLTAATGGVLRMLEQRLRGAEERLTETELQAIAKRAYDELLAELCTQQRARPSDNDHHSALNFTMIDYFQRLADVGRHASIEQPQIEVYREAGWNEERIRNLARIIQLREDGNIDPISEKMLDRQLRLLGHEPTADKRKRVELALYEPFRDAHVAAEERLWESERRRSALWEPAPVVPAVPPSSTQPVVVDSKIRGEEDASLTPHAVPEKWATATATQVAEWLIAEDPKLSPHRRSGKRARVTVGEQTLRQIRWAANLMERSMHGRPFWTLCKEDLKTLDEWFERLPVQFGKSPKHRDLATSLEAACREAEDKIEEGDYSCDDIGLEVGTTNKHFRKLIQIFEHMKKELDWLPALPFAEYITADIKDERAARAAYTVEQGIELFSLPPWTGCADVKDRLSRGSHIRHDSLYFVLLLVWYTGMRREEVCKLLVSDIEEYEGIHHIHIRGTEAGRVKNHSSVRLIAISDELMRLGFIDYVKAIDAAGHTAIFPELVSERKNAKKGDTFYKLWWIYLKPMMTSLQRGQAMHSARHMVDTELKELEVFPEARDDALGHKGKGEGPSRYAKATRLKKLQILVNQIPVVTEHLRPSSEIRLLPDNDRRPRPTRAKTDG